MAGTARLEDIEDPNAGGTALLSDIDDTPPEVKSAIASVPRPKPAPVRELSPIYEHPGDPFSEETVKEPQAGSPASGAPQREAPSPSWQRVLGGAYGVVTDPGMSTGGDTGIPSYGPQVTHHLEQLGKPGQRVTGALGLAATGLESAAPIMGPAALESGPATAAAVDAAPTLGKAAWEIVKNPVVRGLGEGYVASKGAGYVAKKAGVSDENRNLIESLFMWAPGVARSMGELLGLGNPQVGVRTGEDGTGIGISGSGGTRAGVAVTPEGIHIGGQFRGGQPHSVTIPRGGAAGPEPALEPPTIEGQVAPPPTDIPQPTEPHPGAPVDHMAEGASNAVAMANEEAQAMRMVSGLPATPPPPPVPPPPAPPIPPETAGNHITPQDVQKVGAVIAQVPEEMRPQAIIEAHQTLSQSILQQGKFVTPEGKLEIVTKPEQAEKIAQKIVNDQVKQAEKDFAEKSSKSDENSTTTGENKPEPEVQSAHVSEIQEEPQVAKLSDIVEGHGNNNESVGRSIQSGGNKEIAEGVESAPAEREAGAAAGRKGVVQTVRDESISGAGSDRSNTLPAGATAASTSKFQKGDQVVLKDGTKAEVTFSHPTMGILRVRTADGRNISTGARSLTKAESINGRESTAVGKAGLAEVEGAVSGKPVRGEIPSEQLGQLAPRGVAGAVDGGSGEALPTAPKAEKEELAPGKVGEMKVSHLNLSPHEFQYKLGTDAEGVGTLLKETKVWNPDLGGQMSVWKHTKNGKFYVVNGHHRFELAKRTGTKTVTVRHIKAKDAVEARAIGAMQNIADGRGTALDAAKYFRDTGATAEALAAKGISLGEATAKNGLALSHLDPAIFNRVVSGDLRPGRAIAIGEATKDAAEQKAILSLVEKKEAKGGKVSDDTLSELIRMVKGSEQTTESTADLFGSREITRSLALEKAEISAHIKQQLAKDKKLFGFVAKGDRATELARAGNKIDVEKSKEISTGAAQAEEVYNKLSERGGPIASILDEAARRLADGKESPVAIKSDAYQRVRAEVSKTLGGTTGPGTGRSEGASGSEELEGKPLDKPDGAVGPLSDESLFTPAKGPILPSDARDISFEVRTTRKGLPPYIRLNPSAIIALNRIMGVSFRGVAISPTAVPKITKTLHEEASRMQSGRHFAAAAKLRSLADVMTENSHTKDGLILVGANENAKTETSTLYEELLHSVMQLRPGSGNFYAGVPWREMIGESGMARMAVERIVPQLMAAKIEPDAAKVVAEGSVDLLKGEATELTPKEAGESATKYFEALADEHGIQSLQDIREVLDYVADIEQQRTVAHNREEYAIRKAATDSLGRVYEERRGKETASGGGKIQSGPQTGGPERSGKTSTQDDNRASGEIEGSGGPPEGTGSTDKGNLHSTQPVGLTDEELETWAESKGFRYEPAGEQLGMFGSNDQVMRVYRLGPKGKEQSGLVYQQQLDALQKPKEEPANPDDFQLTSQEAPKDDQPRLFGAGDMGEIIGGRNSLFHNESGSFEPGKIVSYLRDEIHANKQARELHSGLSDLESQHQADVLRAVHTMEAVNKELGKDAPKEFAHIYDHLEDPEKIALSPKQDKLLDDIILPLMDESNRIFTKLTDGGLPAENYVHRVVKGKGGFFDRIIGGSKGTGRGNLLQKSSPQQKHRTMMAVESVPAEPAYPFAKNTAAPERKVVSIKGGMVTAWNGGQPEDLGGLRSGLTTRQGQLHEKVQPIQQEIRKLQHERRVLSETPGRIATTFERRKHITEEIDKLEKERDALINQVSPDDLHDQRFVDKQGREWEIVQATTKEIERETDLKYYHNALASALVSFLQLRKAERGYDFIESYKNNPQFSEIAHKQGDGNPPEGWRPTTLPQLRGYSFEPHTAEVLDHYAEKLKGQDPNIFDKIGQFLRTSIFFNPLIHTPNIAVHWAVEKGVPRGFAPTRWAGLYRSSVKAINAVTHQNQDFLDALDAGAPLQSQREDTQKLTKLFFDQLTDALDKNEGWATKLSTAVGMSPVNLVKAIYKFSGKVTWVTNDVAFLQATYEKTAKGMALKDALKETAKHIPDYRLPVRIFNSTALAKLMSNPTLTMFGAYHYGALKSYGEMAKSALGASEPPPGRSKAAEAAHGWELLAGIGLVTFVLYPLLDELAKKLSGDPNAQVRRAGAATLPYNLYMMAKHEKSAADVTQSVVTPAVHTKTALELGFNRDFRTGRQIYDPTANWREQGQQIGRRLLESISPVGAGLRASEDQGARKRFVWGLGGVSFPLHGAEKIASEIAQTKPGTKPEDPKSRITYESKRRALEGLRKGDSGPLNEEVKAGHLSPDEVKRLRSRAHFTPLQDKVHEFTYLEFMKVYNAATPEQKKELDPIARQKRANLLKKHRGAEIEAVDQAAQ